MNSRTPSFFAYAGNLSEGPESLQNEGRFIKGSQVELSAGGHDRNNQNDEGPTYL